MTHTRTSRTRRATFVGAVIITLMAVGIPLAEAATETPEPVYTGCLKISGNNQGNLVAVAEAASPVRACTASERQVKLSGGDITSVSAGTGMQLSDNFGLSDTTGDARVSIAAPYRLPQSCTDGQVVTRAGNAFICTTPAPPSAPTQVFWGHSNSGGDISDGWAQLKAPMQLPAGSWSIVAKVEVKKALENDTSDLYAECRVDVTGAQGLDHTLVQLPSLDFSDMGQASIVLTAGMTKTVPSGVNVVCQDGGRDMKWEHLSITATQTTSAVGVNL